MDFVSHPHGGCSPSIDRVSNTSNEKIFMHQALESTEILRAIFRWCDKGSNAKNALVNKSWSEIGLDLLWEVITDINVIFGLLGEISTSNSTRFYSWRPTSAEWHRFQTYYAHRVKTLDFTNLDGTQQSRMTSIFNTLARLQYSTPIFPNLTSITWRDLDSSGYTHHSTIFMHSKVTRFRLIAHQTEDIREDLLNEYFHSVSERMPNIDRLQVEILNQSHKHFREPLKAVFRDLHCLENLSLPAMSDNSDMTESLSPYPKLRGLNFVRMAREDGVKRMTPSLAVDAFRHLISLQIHTPYSVITHFLHVTPNFAARLTSLDVTSTLPQSESPSVVKDLLEVIASRFGGSLRSLHVRIDTRFPPDTPQSPSIYDVVSFQHVEAVLRCSEMKEFSFTHSLPLYLRPENVEKIASSWPFIVNLHLCVDPRRNFPSDSSMSHLGFDSLIPFTKGCPSLEKLELPLDPTRVPRLVDEHELQAPIEPLRKMRIFSPGNVGPTDNLEYLVLVEFLSRILPPNCEISFHTSWENTSGSPVTPEKWTMKWKDIREGLVPVDQKNKKQEALQIVESDEHFEISVPSDRFEVLNSERIFPPRWYYDPPGSVGPGTPSPVNSTESSD
ncbi:hypothetical protein E1B28_013126 [Marasmius oreades]|uniref:F-box domain-containing protein n=1 Tax=Marasmius oreades TaxID=181124 RepID=A0A9P7RP07_9AGAR|nr:uncharacterized protein E1B28_013126 [Marasmius oreades]KAG7087146.1 hypothetical protein E1B28_013126 [Marasmius oreades]